MVKQGWLLDQRSTRLLFVEYSAKGSLVAEKTIALVFLSLGLLSFCVADLHNPSDVLPNSFHVFISFTAVLNWIDHLIQTRTLHRIHFRTSWLRERQ